MPTLLAHGIAPPRRSDPLVSLRGASREARGAARDLSPDSDLGTRLVTTDVGSLTDGEINMALAAGGPGRGASIQWTRWRCALGNTCRAPWYGRTHG